jgi:hypothetical protein
MTTLYILNYIEFFPPAPRQLSSGNQGLIRITGLVTGFGQFTLMRMATHCYDHRWLQFNVLPRT